MGSIKHIQIERLMMFNGYLSRVYSIVVLIELFAFFLFCGVASKCQHYFDNQNDEFYEFFGCSFGIFNE